MTLGFRDVLGLDGTFFGTISGGPVLGSGAAAQRDADRTFLVDVDFSCYDPASGSQPVSITVEWSIGTANAPADWHAATAQPYDRLHTAGNPPGLTGVPAIAPGKPFRFVWNAYQDLPKGTFRFLWLRVTVVDVALLEAEIVVGPIVVTTEVAGTTDPLTAQLSKLATLALVSLEVLGNGLDVPFRRGPRDFVSVSKVDLVRARVRQILGMRAAFGDLFGELPWRPDLGQKIWTLRHRGNTSTLRARAAAFAREALLWEPSVRVIGVEVEEPPGRPGLAVVHVTYEVILDELVSADATPTIFTDSARVAA